MPDVSIELHPPRDEQVFEDFCRDLFHTWSGDSAKQHGRRGQPQHGVDVYFKVDGSWVGVQCKKKAPGQELTPAEVEKEVAKARDFKSPLAKLIVVTTAPRDVKAQDTERDLRDRHAAGDLPFEVEIKFWDELVEMLGEHPLVYKRWRRRLSLGQDPQVSTHRLPAAKGAELVGREEELARLDEAWRDAGIHAISLIAVGGAGKTALVEHWLQRLEREGWGGAEAVFVWSFYSQGAGVERQASGDLFVAEALRFFGDREPEAGSAREKGSRLAGLVRERHCLLVLDGLEPIQHPPAFVAKAGEIKDPAVAVLVRELAASQPGLLVLTSREAVVDLKSRRETSAPVVDLRRLGKEAGAALLSRLGVKGKTEELATVTEEVHGHALTLTLLGAYLAAAHEGDVRAWHNSPLLAQAQQVDYGHAGRVMAAYVGWFEEPPKSPWQRFRRRLGKRYPSPESQLLSLLGLFDRPADAGALTALREPPSIPGLTDRLVDLSQPQWNIALKRLRKARLVLEELGGEKEIDAHPLVREHFGRVLEAESPEAFRGGHQRLYEHYAAAAPPFPDTLEQMEPLYRAIGHGCRAGRRQEVCDEVYWRRVHRGNEFYGLHKLGAFGADLTALAGFFERTWDRLDEELRPGDRSFLLNQAAVCLRALGRLGEAVEPMAAGLELGVQAEDWNEAARRAGNLSELTLTLGQVSRSVEAARESVELAERSGDAFMRLANRTTLADALHAAGELAEAEAAFRQAEDLQAEDLPDYPKLTSLQGYQYCDLLLVTAGSLDGSGLDRAATEAAGEEARGLCEEVLARGRSALEVVMGGSKRLLDIALAHLSLGRARLGLALATEGSLDEAAAELDRAVQGLRKAGDEEFVARGLLARAALHRFAGDAEAAETDLTEALEIAERGRMRLHECDVHLEWGRLCRVGGDFAGTRGHLETARRIVEETGYKRRQREVGELEEALARTPATG